MIGDAADPTVKDLVVAWTNLEPAPKVVVEESLRLVWSNASAAQEIASGSTLAVRDGRLEVGKEEKNEALLDFVKGCGSELRTFCLPCDHGEEHILFRAWELRRSDSHRYIGLIFYRSGAEFSIRYADLDKVFRFTASEHRILMLMLEGLTAEELSQRLGSSLETVRTHIRNIYGKLKVTSREGMFSRLRPYRV